MGGLRGVLYRDAEVREPGGAAPDRPPLRDLPHDPVPRGAEEVHPAERPLERGVPGHRDRGVRPAAALAFEGRRLELDTLFLDAGGVLAHPDWARVSEALGRQGVRASAEALRAAEPRARGARDATPAVP